MTIRDVIVVAATIAVLLSGLRMVNSIQQILTRWILLGEGSRDERWTGPIESYTIAKDSGRIIIWRNWYGRTDPRSFFEWKKDYPHVAPFKRGEVAGFQFASVEAFKAFLSQKPVARLPSRLVGLRPSEELTITAKVVIGEPGAITFTLIDVGDLGNLPTSNHQGGKLRHLGEGSFYWTIDFTIDWDKFLKQLEEGPITIPTHIN